MPLLARLGCATSRCHGAFAGQGGMALSLFGGSPGDDYETLVKAERARRVNRWEPAQSLLLLKATATIQHGGGKKVAPDSDEYRALLAWIEQGARYDDPSLPRLESLTFGSAEATLAKGAQQPLMLKAVFSDGSQEDVTRMAAFRSSDSGVAAVDASGKLTAADFGMCTIVGQYARHRGAVQIVVPQPLDGPFPAFEPAGKIDELVLANLRKLGLPPAGPCSDEVFLRRVFLDVTGTLPSPEEARAFVADKNPAKRKELIESLLRREEFVAFWALKWSDLLRIKGENPVNLWPKGAEAYCQWVYESVARNRPYDQIARELLTATGSNFRYGPSNFYRAVPSRDPRTYGESAALVFLGARLLCARCHGHPEEAWGLDDNLGMAALFGQIRLKVTVQLELHGVNLPGERLAVKIPADASDVHWVTVQRDGLRSNALPLAVDDLPEAIETEPNDAPAAAQAIAVPVVINGRIQAPGDADHFAFQAEAGQTLALEVNARRLGSPLDSILTLYDSAGRKLAEHDDPAPQAVPNALGTGVENDSGASIDPRDARLIHRADARLVHTFDSAGKYVLRIGDVTGQGGREYAYRLKIAPAEKDFALRVKTGAANVVQGDSALVAVDVFRSSGFDGPVRVEVQGLPAGFIASPTIIPAEQNDGQLTLSAPADAATGLHTPHVFGKADVDSRPIRREGIPLETVGQAFYIKHMLPTEGFLLHVGKQALYTLSSDAPPGKELSIPRKDGLKIVVKAARLEGGAGQIVLGSAGLLPQGIMVRPAILFPGMNEATISVTAAPKAAADTAFNLVISGTMRIGPGTVAHPAGHSRAGQRGLAGKQHNYSFSCLFQCRSNAAFIVSPTAASGCAHFDVLQRLDLREGLDRGVPDAASAEPQPVEVRQHGQMGQARADEPLVWRLEPAPMVQAQSAVGRSSRRRA